MRLLGMAAVALLLLLVAMCSGEQQCRRKLNCALVRCGIPRCSNGYKVALRPCACCPSCVPDTNIQEEQASGDLVRQRRQLTRKSGSARLQSKLHSHKAQGFLVPEKYRHLLRGISSPRQTGK